jgi:hypothetical protein
MPKTSQEDQPQVVPAKPRTWPKWMSRRQASDYLQTVHGIRVAYQTLAQHAMHGTGPAYRKQHRFTVYDRTDLERWADLYLSKPCVSTAEHFVQEEQRRKAGIEFDTGHRFDRRKRVNNEPERPEQPAA